LTCRMRSSWFRSRARWCGTIIPARSEREPARSPSRPNPTSATLPQSRFDGHVLRAPQNDDLDGVARPLFTEPVREVLGVPDFNGGEPDHHVALSEAGLCSGAPGTHV